MLREPQHERIVELASKIEYSTVRPEPSRRAPIGFSHSLVAAGDLTFFLAQFEMTLTLFYRKPAGAVTWN